MASKLDPFRDVILGEEMTDVEIAEVAEVQPTTVANYRRALERELKAAEDIEAVDAATELEDTSPGDSRGSSSMAVEPDASLIAEMLGDGPSDDGMEGRVEARPRFDPLADVAVVEADLDELDEEAPEVMTPRVPEPSPRSELEAIQRKWRTAERKTKGKTKNLKAVLIVEEPFAFLTINAKGNRVLRQVQKSMYRGRMAQYVIRAAAQLGNLQFLRVQEPQVSPRGWQRERAMELMEQHRVRRVRRG